MVPVDRLLDPFPLPKRILLTLLFGPTDLPPSVHCPYHPRPGFDNYPLKVVPFGPYPFISATSFDLRPPQSCDRSKPPTFSHTLRSAGSDLLTIIYTFDPNTLIIRDLTLLILLGLYLKFHINLALYPPVFIDARARLGTLLFLPPNTANEQLLAFLLP